MGSDEIGAMEYDSHVEAQRIDFRPCVMNNERSVPGFPKNVVCPHL